MGLTPKKWTKKDIKALCAQLDTYWLSRSPDRTLSSEREARARMATQLANVEQRTQVVLSGLRGMRALHADRYLQECQTIGNAIVRDIYGSSRDEFVERFIKLAKESDADQAMYEALVLRVYAEGLPSEVLSYDPTSR